MLATSRGSPIMSKCARFGFAILFALHGLILVTPRLSGQAQPLKPDAATPSKYIPVRQPFTSAELDWVKSEAKRFVNSEGGQAKVVFCSNS